MNDTPIIKLTALTKHFGNDLLNDFARCDELLADFCGEYRLEVNLLISALREGCAKELLEDASDGVVVNDMHVRLVSHLQHNAGIMEEYAEWAVQAVATALELQIEAPIIIKQPVSVQSVNSVTTTSPPVVPEVITPPTSIPAEHYEDVCNILLKSGSNWKDPTVWSKIDSHVKRLCAKANLGEHEIRNWMRFAWPSVERRYEVLQIKEQREKLAAEKKMQEENQIKEHEADHYRNHIMLLRAWFGNLPNAKWDFDQWDTFVSSLESPVNINDLEYCRDNGIVNYNDYFENDDEFSIIHLKTGLVWAKNGDIAGRPMRYDDAMYWVKNLVYGGYSDWRLPSEEENKIFAKLGGAKPSVWFNSNGFINVQRSTYWSSSTDGAKSAWVVNMDDGGSNCLFKVSAFYAWPVRNQWSR
ncbi:MAG: DUF1566 domain-containing protein [Chlorobium sp.]|nr:DUF1566 domain-containing protein [Chlorobium sp.]